MKNMKLKMVGPGIGCLLFLIPITGFAALTSKYVDQTVLVYRAAHILTQRLPYRTLLDNALPVHGSDVTLACRGVHLGPDELVAFLPQSQSCIPLTAHSVSSLRQALGYASISGFNKDKPGLEQRLELQPVVVMEPLEATPPPGSVCECNRPERVFMDGFEDFISLFYSAPADNLWACRDV